ncbi:GGDEF domain-containing protein [Deinococcus yavapaiensis]|uniref:Diguanylate cyclase (GGDEF)-like protein n=1 Tax=Deinococcus yavapaiensis KR-236 TaxID=694435 RepID=A0A318SBB3_9DEIO|nr:GGDEF domain-containing protein [Deinococcus yavapaiensis]PYE53579.1 diguanylate cyclase (GGDEF)-like protein [Deinococcus yavapaiensis KR-236]
MTSPDLSFASLIIAVLAVMTASYALFLALTRPSYPGWRAWAASILLGSIGFAVVSVRSPSTLLFSVLVGNGLVALSGVLAVTAYRRFIGVRRTIERAWMCAVPPLLLSLAWLTIVTPAARVRVVLMGVYSVSVALALIVLCLRGAARQQGWRSGYLLNVLVFAAYLALLAPRTFEALGTPSALLNALTFSPLAVALYVMAPLVATTGGTFALLLLHDDRRRMEVAALHAHLGALSETDGLTGLVNRRGLEARFRVEVTHADSRPLSFALVDIDHFKRINDEHGHLVGDRCLKRLTDALRRASRSSDCLARYGGEEFVLLLPGANVTQARATLRRVQDMLRLESHPIPSFTISAGVAACRTDDAFSTAFDRADRLLYSAKRAGRDRVHGSDDAFSNPSTVD